MNSKRSHEGCLLIDHKDSPGISPEDVAHIPGAIAVPGGVKFESATIVCSHCQVTVVLNPNRQRSRGYCPKCDHYVCDVCEFVRVASGGECRDFQRVIEQEYERNFKKGFSVI